MSSEKLIKDVSNKENISSSYNNNTPLVYTVVRNKAYDLTSFLDEHPGGRDLLILANTRDGTALFEGYHGAANPARIKTKLTELEIPIPSTYISDPNLPTFTFDDEFWLTFKIRLRQYFNGKSRKANYFKFFTWILSLITLYISTISFWNGEYWSIPVFGTLLWIVGTRSLHDGTHATTFNSPFVNKCVGCLGALHMNPWAWLHSHIYGHHIYSNIEEYDIDHDYIENYKYMNAWVRNLIKIPITAWWTSFFEAPLFEIYGKWPRQSASEFYDFCTKSEGMPYAFGNFLRLIFVLMYIIQPFTKLSEYGLIKTIIFATWPVTIHSIWEWHWTMPIHHLAENDRPKYVPGVSWAKWQVENTHDANPRSIFLNWLTIGTSNQALHHLIPGVDPVHFPYISPILEQTCKDFDVTYRYKDSAMELFYYFYTNQD